MALFALGDLHLSFAQPKPMDIFGSLWFRHWEKIYSRWGEVVSDNDLVIVPGDISWAMDLRGAEPDLEWLSQLPGEKLLLRGNHDYWWSGIGKVRKALYPGMHALQNDHYPWGKWAICGTRGWLCPGDRNFDIERDGRIYRRAVQRLELSLGSAVAAGYSDLVVALHYPPTNSRHEPSGFTELFHRFAVTKVVYGHLHGEGHDIALQGNWHGIDYHLVAADAVDFTPVPILP